MRPLRTRSVLLKSINICGVVFAAGVLSTAPHPFAAEQLPNIPAWLSAHVGEGDGQIADPVLRRARALYLQKRQEGVVKNSCYFAMTPHVPTVWPTAIRRRDSM